jgi:hypothetical protein
MSISLTRFSPGVLTDAQLNAIVDAITAKFNGQIGGADLQTPLKLPGNLDMQQFEILHLVKLWNTYNISQRASGTTFQSLLDTINSAGGGVALLPAATTETIGTGGVTVGANTVIAGQGETSVFAVSGTQTAHMFSNKAAGNSGILFVGCKLDNSGSAGGSFDIVGFDRTTRFKFVDCTVAVTRQNGVTLTTGSAGSSCTRGTFQRVIFDLTAGTGSALNMTDVQRVRVRDCEFNISASATAITFTALGATSNCEKLRIQDNEFNFTSAANQVGVVITAGATNGITQSLINGNIFHGGGTSNTSFVDVNGGVSTVDSELQVLGNIIRAGTTNSFAMRFRLLKGFTVSHNDVKITGTGIGILIGATARTGAVAVCTNYTVSNNDVDAPESCYVFCHPGTGTFGTCVVSDNKGVSTDASHAEFEIWNLAAHPTTLGLDMTCSGNQVDDGSASVASWRCYTDFGVTQGGRAGSGTPSNFVFSLNNATGATFGAAGGSDDFHDTTDGVTRKYIKDLNIT